ncbi:MAG: metallophosphoesterase family protein [Candidatus Aenigmarchaeota archaeon]|nr:metallophosphoesterase family protein [Candidatus Aenigmarchaeota archaeon]
MDKKKIVQYFLERGFLISPDVLEKLSKFNDSYIFNKIIENSSDIFLTQFSENKVRVIKNLVKIPREIKTEQFIKFFQDKYKKMQKIFLRRTKFNFVSLNKLGKERKEVYIFGIVKNIKEKADKKIVEIEDMTTSVKVEFSLNVKNIDNLMLDEAIVVRGISAGDYLFGKEIIYPDIPLRSPTKGQERVCFISDLHLDETPPSDIKKFFDWFKTQKISYLLVAGDISDKKSFINYVKDLGSKVFLIPGEKDDSSYPALGIKLKEGLKNVISLSNPAMIEINGVKILMIHKFNLDMLKKRYLGQSKLILNEDYLVLDVVPDIVHCGHTHEPEVKNYKSATIVNSGSPLSDFKPVVINLADRSVEQIRL